MWDFQNSPCIRRCYHLCITSKPASFSLLVTVVSILFYAFLIPHHSPLLLASVLQHQYIQYPLVQEVQSSRPLLLTVKYVLLKFHVKLEEKRPSVNNATSAPNPIPAIADVGANIYGIPGPPLGHS